MHVFSVPHEQAFNPTEHVEKILAKVEDGDVTVACWEPGQISPYHCHPDATEIYFCFVVHPPGELHEYENGSQRTLLFRIRYGRDMAARQILWRGKPGWEQLPEDAAYFRKAARQDRQPWPGPS
jgi:hypothetical protein